MAKKNRKHSVPHLPFAAGFVPRRHKFMDGTIKAYFAPGHKPDINGTTYYNPTDWMKENALLRPPQVVWLEVRIFITTDHLGTSSDLNGGNPLITTAGYDSIWHSDGAVVIFHQQGDWEAYQADNITGDIIGPLAMPVTWEGGLWPHTPTDIHPTQESQVNLAMVEKGRLKSVFDGVKSRIESKRPGRTWVQVVNWEDGWMPGRANNSTITSNQTVPTQVPVPGGIEYDLRNHSSAWFNCSGAFLECPHVGVPAYYGTDFLGIFCGNPFPGGGDVEDWNSLDFNPSAFLASSFFTNLYNTYKDSFNRFHGLSTRLFHPDLSWAPWTIPGTVVDNDCTETWLANKAVFWRPFSGVYSLNRYDVPAHTDHYTGRAETGVDDYHCITMVGNSSSIFDQVATMGHDDHLDITHPGGTSMVAEDYLVNLIAEHYRFDPASGKDLPDA